MRCKQLIDLIDEFGHCHVTGKFSADPSFGKIPESATFTRRIGLVPFVIASLLLLFDFSIKIRRDKLTIFVGKGCGAVLDFSFAT
jgi:hypothetical protein